MSKPRTLKKARVDRPPKENVKPRDGDQEGEDRVPKRKIPAQKPVNKPRLKPISWRERKSCSRPRSFVAGRKEDIVVKDKDYRRPPPDFKIPLKRRQNNPGRYQNRRAHSPHRDEQFGRYGGFGRGYRPFGGAGRGRPRALPFTRRERMPGFTPEQHTHTHTHTHNRFTALWNLSGKTRVSRYQKKHRSSRCGKCGKTPLDLNVEVRHLDYR